MFETLEAITARPAPFEFYTAADLWTDPHTSERMLQYHLNSELDVSSRNHAFIDRSAEWIADYFKLGDGSEVIDFGCGPGLYASRLARKKAAVTALDFSPRSIQYARDQAASEGLNIHYEHANYLEFEPEGRFDLAIMIMCDFCALSPAQRRTMLEKFHRILKPGGAILLDVYSLPAFEKREETFSCEIDSLAGFWSPMKYYGFLSVHKYEDEKAVLDKYTLIEANRARTVYNWLQYFTPETLQAEFEGAGFKVESILGDVAGSVFDPVSDEFAIIARRP